MPDRQNRDYPSDWGSRRRKVYRRDNYTCQNCGAQGGPRGNAALHAHHIVPRKDGGSDNVSNLQTLCKDCHDAIHNNSKAPTAGTGGSEVDRITNLTLDRSEYPERVRSHIQLIKKIVELNELTENLGNHITKLSDIIERYLDAGSRDLEISPKLSNRYRNVRDGVDSILDDLRSKRNYLEVIDTEHFSQETMSLLRTFKKDLERYIQRLVELIDVFDEIARIEEESTDWDSIEVNSIEVSMAIDDLETEDISDSGSKLLTKLYRKIQRARTTYQSENRVDDYVNRHNFSEK